MQSAIKMKRSIFVCPGPPQPTGEPRDGLLVREVGELELLGIDGVGVDKANA